MSIGVASRPLFADHRAGSGTFGGVPAVCFDLSVVRHDQAKALLARHESGYLISLEYPIRAVANLLGKTDPIVLDVPKRLCAARLIRRKHPIEKFEIRRRQPDGFRFDSKFVQL